MSTSSVRRGVFTSSVCVSSRADGLADGLGVLICQQLSWPGAERLSLAIPPALGRISSNHSACLVPVLTPLAQGHGGCRAVELEPRLGRAQAIVHVLDVLYALVGQPVFQCFDALLAIDRNGVFPCGGARADAGEVDPGFGDELKRLGERLVAHAGREVDEGLLRYGGGFAE